MGLGVLCQEPVESTEQVVKQITNRYIQGIRETVMQKNEQGAMPTDQQERFEKDFAWLSQHKGWNANEEEDVRGHIARCGKPAIRFWWCLAKAKQAGYRWDEQSGFEKLQDFCIRTGMPGPVITKEVNNG